MSEAVRQLRQNARVNLEYDRRNRSIDTINSFRRGFTQLTLREYSEADVERIASRLKGKGSIDADELTVLIYALNEHEDHINAYFNVNGSLHGLIRELTGNNAYKQMLSIGCICNLALSNSRSSFNLAKSSGAYLITYLHQSQNKNLLELCAWALGNIVATNERASDLLKNQGIIDNLFPLMDNNNDIEVINAAAYAFSQMLYMKWNILEDRHIVQLSEIVCKEEIKSLQLLWLLYLLSDKESARVVFNARNMFQSIVSCLINTVSTSGTSNHVVADCLVRIAANLSSMYDFKENPNWFYCEEVLSVLKITYNDSKIKNDTMWLLGNVFNLAPNSQDKEIFFSKLFNSINSQ